MKRVQFFQILLAFAFGVFANVGFVTGLQCYKELCWGDECFGFEARRDDLVDQCPDDARGCLFSFGTVKPDSNSALFIESHAGIGNPLRRETRSCWVPSRIIGGIVPKGELEQCHPTKMYHYFQNAGQMVYVNSLECICSGNLCNGNVLSKSSTGKTSFDVMLIITTIAPLYLFGI